MLFVRDRTDEILRQYLDQDFYCAAAGEQAPSKARLREVARRYGCRLPNDFLKHSTGKLGGIYVEVKEAKWPRPKPFEVGPFWSFLYAVFVFGVGTDVPDWMNMELAAKDFSERTGRSLVPCMKRVGDADLYLFDEHGKIVQWRHETDELEPFNGSFFDLFESEICDLRKRKDMKIAKVDVE